MKTILLLCLVTASSVVSAAEPSREESGPRAAHLQTLASRPLRREALPEGSVRSRWVEAVRVAFHPLREKGGPRGAHLAPREH